MHRLKQLRDLVKAGMATYALAYFAFGGLLLAIVKLNLFFQLSDTIVGVLIGTGSTLMITGLAEYLKYLSSTATLDIKPDLEVFTREGIVECRLILLVRNSGSTTVKSAKGIIDVLKPSPEELRELLVGGLVNKHNPIIRGEPLSWAISENPILEPVPALIRSLLEPENRVLTHTTSIAPYQTARLLLLAFRREGNTLGLYIFGEYNETLGLIPVQPKAHLRLPLDGQVELKLRVAIVGEGLRRPYVVELALTPQLLRKMIKCVEESRVDEASSMLAGIFKLV